jgi:very-short-patch-repair endonuclease
VRISVADAQRLGALPKAKPKTAAQRQLAKAEREKYEDALAADLDRAGFRGFYSRQAAFHPGRKWIADFILVGAYHPTLLIEVDGGMWIRGSKSHGSGGYEKDRARDAETLAGGRLVLRVTPRQVIAGLAIEWVKAILKRWARP